MQLTSNDLAYLSECAISAAKQAGNLIESYTTKTVLVRQKHGDGSYASQVVTEVDLLSDAIIKGWLQTSCERYDLALLSEENAEESEEDNTRLHKDYFWCVDPMDGTLSFIESTPGFSVSIALVAKNGTPIIGVVYDPTTHTLYTAVRGQGVLRNGKPWIFSLSIEGKPLTFVYDRGFMDKPDYVQINKALLSIANKRGFKGVNSLEKNGAVLNALWVLENSPACYFKFPKPEKGGGSLWDFAATTVIFHEMNAIATDMYGQPLDLNRADSTYMNHRGILFTTDQLLATDIQRLLNTPESERIGT